MSIARADTDSSTKSSKTDPTLKTRHFVDVVSEITRSMEIHRETGTILGGVHLELTGEVNEDGYSVVSSLQVI
jgi:3-deoxy-7-phosphoheptulonate synthase